MLILTAHGGIRLVMLVQSVALIVFSRDLAMKVLGAIIACYASFLRVLMSF